MPAGPPLDLPCSAAAPASGKQPPVRCYSMTSVRVVRRKQRWRWREGKVRELKAGSTRERRSPPQTLNLLSRSHSAILSATGLHFRHCIFSKSRISIFCNGKRPKLTLENNSYFVITYSTFLPLRFIIPVNVVLTILSSLS